MQCINALVPVVQRLWPSLKVITIIHLFSKIGSKVQVNDMYFGMLEEVLPTRNAYVK